MVYKSALTAVTAALLLAAPVCAESMYTKSSPVVQVDAKSYDRLIAKSNHTAIVEFYAPWCGHCKNLKPAYEKAAEKLKGIAKVAAVNCDEDANKQFCGSMGVQGFPTLKIVKPGKKGSPIVEDYQGERSTKAIVEAVKSKLPNHVKKLTDSDSEAFLSESPDTPKAILVTDKGTISPTMKSLAIDFLGSITFGQVRSKEEETVKRLGVSTFPKLVLLPAGSEKEPIVYDGELVREDMLSFLSQIATPNPDPAPAKKKEDKQTKKAKESSSSSAATSSETPVVEEAQKPIVPEVTPPLTVLATAEELSAVCLGEKTSTCVLAIVPETKTGAEQLLESFAKIAHTQRSHLPFYEVPASNPLAAKLKTELGLTGDVEAIAVNARRGWWKHFDSADHSAVASESWVDAIKMGEGAKSKLPEGVVVTEVIVEPVVESVMPGATESETGYSGTQPTEPATEEVEESSVVPEPEATPTPNTEVEAEPTTPPAAESEVETPAPEASLEPEATEKPVKHEEL